MKNLTTSFTNLWVTKNYSENVFIQSTGSIETSSGTVSLSEQNFALRGCSLKNTEFVIGLVAYTG